MAKELHYFNYNGLAESIRYILHYTKQEFKDVRYEFTNWPDQKIKDSLPYGQFPLYKEGDRVLNQSTAIAKYVSRGTELIPTDIWEQAVLDNIVSTIYDYYNKVLTYAVEYDLDRKYALKKKVMEETLDFYFSRFEKLLKGNGGFFIGKLSWAEFILCGLIESSNCILNTIVEKNYPTIKAVVEKIRNLPAVKEYIATRNPYKLPGKIINYKGLDIMEPNPSVRT